MAVERIYIIFPSFFVSGWLFNSLSKIGEFVNSVDLDEVAHEPPHLDLHCLPLSL